MQKMLAKIVWQKFQKRSETPSVMSIFGPANVFKTPLKRSRRANEDH